MYKRQIIGVAFGKPLSNRTFSGYSRHLFLALHEMGALKDTISSKSIRIRDFLDGCTNFSPLRNLRRPNLSVRWLWNPATINRLSMRLQERLSQFDDAMPVLQVGTHVCGCNTGRKFYCVTDMTVKQAAETDFFRIADMKPKNIIRAINAQKRIFDSNRKIFVLCEWAKTSIVNDYNQPPEKVIVIGAGANMPRLEPAANKYHSHQILFVGWDWIRKGGPLLLDAFKLVRAQMPDAALNIIGCAPKIFEKGVNIIGRLSRDNPSERAILEQFYKEANCFCILPDFDPFPNVLLEAQITQTPVISLANGSRYEVIKDGVTGLLVKNVDSNEVAGAILKVLSTPQYARQMGLEGRQLIDENFTWPRIAQKVLSHIDNED